LKAKQLTSSYLVVPSTRPLIDWVNCALAEVEENIEDENGAPVPRWGMGVFV
jgi:hypothetical protein